MFRIIFVTGKSLILKWNSEKIPWSSKNLTKWKIESNEDIEELIYSIDQSGNVLNPEGDTEESNKIESDGFVMVDDMEMYELLCRDV